FGNWVHHHKHVDIAILEATAALLGLEAFVNLIKHYWITVYIDNQVARRTIEVAGKKLWQKDIMQQTN
ncbi:22042_t:CDS:2, partial [Cetraspora pellucida]